MFRFASKLNAPVPPPRKLHRPVSIWMHVSHLLEHDLLDVGRTFLYVHLQNFTLGLRLETLALFSASVPWGCTCCITGPILIASTSDLDRRTPNTVVHISCRRRSGFPALFHVSQHRETRVLRRQSLRKAVPNTVCSAPGYKRHVCQSRCAWCPLFEFAHCRAVQM